MPQDFIAKNLGVIFLVLFLWLVGLSFAFWKFLENLNNLTRGTKAGNLVGILKQILASTRENAKSLEKLDKNLGKVATDAKGHLQKVSLLRFNPFGDVGGDQSFVATFLDGENSGIVISSLHSRAGTRVYAKPIDKGQAKAGVKLSNEEERSLKAAIEAR